MWLQATGTYISRSLSYTGAEFAIIRVEVDPVFKVRLPFALTETQHMHFKVYPVSKGGLARLELHAATRHFC